MGRAGRPSGRRRERGESRPLGDESETFVRLLAGAYRVISKHLGDSRFSGIAAVSPAESRRPLSESCLPRNGLAASDLARRAGRATQKGVARRNEAQPCSSP